MWVLEITMVHIAPFMVFCVTHGYQVRGTKVQYVPKSTYMYVHVQRSCTMLRTMKQKQCYA